MPVYDLTSDDWTTGATKLAEVLVPDPADKALGRQRAAAARKAGYESALLEQEYNLRHDIQRAGETNYLRSPAMATGAMVLGDPDILKSQAMALGMQPGMSPEELARIQVATGIQNHAGTRMGEEADQQRQRDATAADNASREAIAGRRLAWDRESFMHNIPENGVAIGLDGKPIAYGPGRNADGTKAGVDAAGGYFGDGDSEYALHGRAFTTLRNKYLSGVALNNDDVSAAIELHRKLTAPKIHQIEDASGAVRTYTVPGTLPPGTEFLSEIVGSATGAGVAEPKSPAGSQEAPDGLPAGATPVGSNYAAVPAKVDTRGTILVHTLVDAPERQRRTEQEGRYYVFAERVRHALYRKDAGLFDVLGYDPVTGTLGPGYRPSVMESLWADNAPTAVRNTFMSDEGQKFKWAAEAVLNPILRLDSGAAVPVAEYPKYWDQFIPLANEIPEVTQAKMDHLLVSLEAFEVMGKSDINFDPMMLKEDSPELEAKQLEFQELRNRLWRQKHGNRIMPTLTTPVEATGDSDPDVTGEAAESILKSLGL